MTPSREVEQTNSTSDAAVVHANELSGQDLGGSGSSSFLHRRTKLKDNAHRMTNISSTPEGRTENARRPVQTRQARKAEQT